jgi:hypothetical protein
MTIKEISLECLVARLPEDITRKIYEDHFSPKQKFDRMINVLNSEQGQRTTELLTMCLKDMFETRDVAFLLYALKHGKEHKFNRIYTALIVNHYKYHIRTKNKYKVMASSWLFILNY